LGIDVLPKKTCSFDCIYCQLGRTDNRTTVRSSYIDVNKLTGQLKAIIKINPRIDYITLSGSGEPTLHKKLNEIIAVIKKETKNKYPVCVITNSSLLHRKEVRKELKNADLIIPSLDAATVRIFNKINRPHKSITVDKIIKGLINLRKEFKGKIWLEIMIAGGLNDSIKEAERLKKIVSRIKPDKVQLNLPIRPAEKRINLPSSGNIDAFRKILGKNTEIACRFPKKKQKKMKSKTEGKILEFLKRRPAKAGDLSDSLGLTSSEVHKHLAFLVKKGRIEKETTSGDYFMTVQ